MSLPITPLRFLCVATACAVAVFRPTLAQSESSIDLEEAARAFELVESLSAADDGRLWGISLAGPVLFVDAATRFAVANVPDEAGELTARDGVHVGELPTEESVANMATVWAGVHWTMVVWPLPENRYGRGRLLMHESFHRIQDRLGLPASNPSNPHLDTETGRTWLRLEWRALEEALLRDGDARRRAIADALTFRAARHADFLSSRESEQALEMNEGLAEYTGLVLSGLPAEVLADRAAMDLEREERSESLVRSFAYASGPAYGLLLDAHAPGWRQNVTARAHLADLLAQALDVRVPPDPRATARDRLDPYEGERVIAQERRREQRRVQQEARDRARYVQGPVLAIPCGPDMRYSFDPRGVRPLGELGSVYEPARVTDGWGVLEADGGALLVLVEGTPTEARVPAPTQSIGPTLEGDGWSLELAEGWHVVAGPRDGDLRLERTP